MRMKFDDREMDTYVNQLVNGRVLEMKFPANINFDLNGNNSDL